METYPNYLEMQEKLELQMPDCYNNGCHSEQMHIIVEQKNLLGQQTSALVANHQSPSDHNKAGNVHRHNNEAYLFTYPLLHWKSNNYYII